MTTGSRSNCNDVTSGSQRKAHNLETKPDREKISIDHNRKSGALFQNPPFLIT